MQLKCTFCATPFALTKDQLAEAVEILQKDRHAHYDAHCPNCRRANKLSRQMFEINPFYRKLLESKPQPAEPVAEAAAEPAAESPAGPVEKPKKKAG
jgi:hypothetical protein